MARALKLHEEKNPAVQRISDMLVKSFDEIGEKIRADLIKGYREYADRYFKRFMETSNKEKGSIIPRGMFGPYIPFQDWHHYVEFKKKKDVSEYDLLAHRIDTWEDVKKAASRASVTYRYSDERANESYEHARDSFVYKNLDKIREVLGKRTDLKNSVIKFDWRNGYFKGNLQIYLENAYFRGDLDIKYVVRTVPRVTPYFQYPLVFVDAEIGGKPYTRPSEQELRNLLSGKTDEQHAQEKAAQATAEGWCPGGGQSAYSQSKGRSVGRYRECPHCRQLLVPTSRGIFAKHKTREAVKASAAEKLADAGYCPMSKQKVPDDVIAGIGPVEGYSTKKAFCPTCKQQARIDDRSEWIRDKFLTETGYPTRMKVESATYYKHKLSK